MKQKRRCRSEQSSSSAIQNEVFMVYQGSFGVLTSQNPNNQNLQKILVEALEQNFQTNLPLRVDHRIDHATDRLNLWRMAKVGSLVDMPDGKKPIKMNSQRVLQNQANSLLKDKTSIERHPSCNKNSTGSYSKELRMVIVDWRINEWLQISEHSSEHSSISSLIAKLSNEAHRQSSWSSEDDRDFESNQLSGHKYIQSNSSGFSQILAKDQLQELLQHTEQKSNSNQSISFDSSTSAKLSNSDLPNEITTNEKSEVAQKMTNRSRNGLKDSFLASFDFNAAKGNTKKNSK